MPLTLSLRRRRQQLGWHRTTSLLFLHQISTPREPLCSQSRGPGAPSSQVTCAVRSHLRYAVSVAAQLPRRAGHVIHALSGSAVRRLEESSVPPPGPSAPATLLPPSTPDTTSSPEHAFVHSQRIVTAAHALYRRSLELQSFCPACSPHRQRHLCAPPRSSYEGCIALVPLLLHFYHRIVVGHFATNTLPFQPFAATNRHPRRSHAHCTRTSHNAADTTTPGPQAVIASFRSSDGSASDVPAPIVKGSHHPASVQHPDSPQRLIVLSLIGAHRSCNETRPQADVTAQVIDTTLALLRRT